ncbi:hypothetical protein RN001_004772 [Aquatica leii]|uniref:Uncharacterized protein n=1 Tax=Aquatica leii TaxID=1421715 RepID=A0AAN7PC26_9COLE|nr:hypothetical protein RN001_004772 [Aquatica leii]
MHLNSEQYFTREKHVSQPTPSVTLNLTNTFTPLRNIISNNTDKYNHCFTVKEVSQVHKFKVVPLNFDGKVSWSTYYKQFETAATVNDWSNNKKVTSLIVSLRKEGLGILKTVLDYLQKNYKLLISRLEMRFGDAHLQQV